MNAVLSDKFATKLHSPLQAPEPLRSALLGVLRDNDSMHSIVFAPQDKIAGQTIPASVLVLLQKDWIFAGANDQNNLVVVRLPYNQLLMVEITSILLFGRLQLDFADNGQARNVVAYFNTVTEGLYEGAVQEMLNAIDDVSSIEVSKNDNISGIKSIPLKFSNNLLKYLPMGQQVLAVAHWAAAPAPNFGIFHHEKAPEGVLALTERELLLITDQQDQGWFDATPTSNYGVAVTHCPLSRIQAIHFNEANGMDLLDVCLQTQGTKLKLKIRFPRESKREIFELAQEAGRLRSFSLDLPTVSSK